MSLISSTGGYLRSRFIRLMLLSSLGFAALAVIAAAYDLGGEPRRVSAAVADMQYLTIRAGEAERYYFEPGVLELSSGVVQVRFINEGRRPHTFNIKDENWHDVLNFDKVDPGSESTFEFYLPPPGSYTYFCSLYKHVDFGQTGSLYVLP